MKIRKTKKAMKKSNGFFTVKVGEMCFCTSEWMPLKYHKKGISLGMAEYLPYHIINKVIAD